MATDVIFTIFIDDYFLKQVDTQGLSTSIKLTLELSECMLDYDPSEVGVRAVIGVDGVKVNSIIFLITSWFFRFYPTSSPLPQQLA